MRTITQIRKWKILRRNDYYVFVGVTSSEVRIELHTQIAAIDKGEYFDVDWSRENTVRLYKAEEGK